MAAMTKRVNIRTTVAVRNITPPISGTYSNVIMSTSDILKCLCRRAFVEEILPDGRTIRLNMKNYYLDNGAGLDAYKPVKAEGKKPEKPVKKDEPKFSEAEVNATIVTGLPDPEEEIEPEKVEERPAAEKIVEVVDETAKIDVATKVETGPVEIVTEAPVEPDAEKVEEPKVVEEQMVGTVSEKVSVEHPAAPVAEEAKTEIKKTTSTKKNSSKSSSTKKSTSK